LRVLSAASTSILTAPFLALACASAKGGAKTFVAHFGVDRRRITIGRYPIVTLAQAREKAHTILARRQLALDHGITPFFGEAVAEFPAARESNIRPSSLSRDERVLKRFDSLSKKRVADITPEAVQDIINRIKAPTSKDEAVQRISNHMRHLKRSGEISNWPVERPRRRRTPVCRDRVLCVTRSWRRFSLRSESGVPGTHPNGSYGVIVELLVLTGQRRQQICSLARIISG
jgi:integrase